MGGQKGLSGRHREAGSRRATKLNMPTPQAVSGVLQPPDDFDEAEKREWEKYSKIMIELKTLAHADYAILATYCRTIAETDKLEADIRANGLSYTTATGMRKLRPETQLRTENRNLLKSLSSILGLNPAARPGIQAIKDNSTKNPFNRWKIT